ncbi:hypothetical protein AV540_07260 [Brevibacillus parabrevis]|nr:hypothetical protein AV540_07260 [Brevibacillus parabrevis]
MVLAGVLQRGRIHIEREDRSVCAVANGVNLAGRDVIAISCADMSRLRPKNLVFAVSREVDDIGERTGYDPLPAKRVAMVVRDRFLPGRKVDENDLYVRREIQNLAAIWKLFRLGNE